MRAVAAPGPLVEPGFLQVLHRVSCTGRRGVRFQGTRPVRWRVPPIRPTLEKMGLATLRRSAICAAVVLPLLVPPSAVAWELLPLEARLALEATEISSAKVCGASECREVSDPEAATALAVGPTPRGTDAPVRGLPWYKSTLTIPAEERRRGATASPSPSPWCPPPG